ncbi:uncharacterized protein BDV14DRAFT_199878 [Aspergillus stella-maris]|uniref:uncharacterized protein n=1 Tax=Aspergillus stella-maris TaxID=1810926 RepID=UPI003CCDAC70
MSHISSCHTPLLRLNPEHEPDVLGGVGYDAEHLDDLLAVFVDDPALLERHRARFDRSPNPNSPPPDPILARPPSAVDRRDKRQDLELLYGVTKPGRQFDAQVKKTFYKHIYPDKGLHRREVVKNHWMKQGIWDDSWNVDDGPPNSAVWSHEQGPADWGRSSRPYHQFMYQFEMRRKLAMEKAGSSMSLINDFTINSKAYESTREEWRINGYWNDEWGVFPGMRWNHELPREDWIKLTMGDNYVSADGQREGGSYRFDAAAATKPMGKYSQLFARKKAANRRAEMQQRLATDTGTGSFPPANDDGGAQRQMSANQTEETPNSKDSSRLSSSEDNSDSGSITTSTPERQPVSFLDIASGSWTRKQRASTRKKPSRPALARKPPSGIPNSKQGLRRSARLLERRPRRAD